jgi:general secretion pathway protein E
MRNVSLLLWVVAALGGATGALAAVLGSPDPPGVGPILAAAQAVSADPTWWSLGLAAGCATALAAVLSVISAVWPAVSRGASPRFAALGQGNIRGALQEIRGRVAACAAPQTPHVVPLLEELVRGAAAVHASDLHITPSGGKVRLTYRVQGNLHEVAEIAAELGPLLVTRVKVLAGLDVFARGVPQDGRLVMDLDGRIVEARVSTLPVESGQRVVLRIVRGSREVPELASLGLPSLLYAKLADLLASPQGLVFVTGPVGSGKTTTLYSAMKHIASTRGSTTALVTLEDPIELELPFATQTQMNPRTGMTFAATLRSVLRQDPNVLMVGEIRDRETADIAMQAGLTGHLILTTVHGQNSAGVFARVAEMGVEPFVLASASLGCLSQRLVRTLCTACRRPADPEPLVRERLKAHGSSLAAGTYFEPVGCQFCEGQGFAARVPIAELLPASPTIRQAVHQRRTSAEIHELAVGEGMLPLLENGLHLAARGITSVGEVMRVAG